VKASELRRFCDPKKRTIAMDVKRRGESLWVTRQTCFVLAAEHARNTIRSEEVICPKNP
jgi:hypothetical protein